MSQFKRVLLQMSSASLKAKMDQWPRKFLKRGTELERPPLRKFSGRKKR